MIGSTPPRLAIGLEDWNPLRLLGADSIRESAPKTTLHTWPRYAAMMARLCPHLLPPLILTRVMGSH
jgi:hypothetical protein